MPANRNGWTLFGVNWFNANSNYNAVVTAAADEASGQGFVTEFAGQSESLANIVWTQADVSQWQAFSRQTFSSFKELFDYSYGIYGGWDGFWDAVRATVTLPSDVTFEDFKVCPNCYSDKVQLSPAAYLQALEKNVIQPVKMVQDLIDARPYVTRLYTTMSAAEMTADPLFTFNKDLADVSNVHTAERIIECNANVTQFEAPWRIELPQGVIRGSGQVGTWPVATAEQPSNTRIFRLAATGSGEVVEDNTEKIAQSLVAMGGDAPPSNGSGGSGGKPGTTMTSAGASTAGTSTTDARVTKGDGCSISQGGASRGLGWLGAVFALAGVVLCRRARISAE